MVEKLAITQNKRLRVVASACRAILIDVPYAETMMSMMQEYLDQLQAKAWTRLIKKQLRKVAAKLRRYGTADTPGRRKDQCASPIMEETADPLPLHRPLPWIEKGEEYVEQICNTIRFYSTKEKS